MTNTFYRKDAILNIYVVNLEEYDKCNLVEDYTTGNPTEDWVSLPIIKDDLKDFLKTIGNPKKIAIHDYESNSSFGSLVIKDDTNIEDLNELAKELENYYEVR